jgi:hypothetical protein
MPPPSTSPVRGNIGQLWNQVRTKDTQTVTPATCDPVPTAAPEVTGGADGQISTSREFYYRDEFVDYNALHSVPNDENTAVMNGLSENYGMTPAQGQFVTGYFDQLDGAHDGSIDVAAVDDYLADPSNDEAAVATLEEYYASGQERSAAMMEQYEPLQSNGLAPADYGAAKAYAEGSTELMATLQTEELAAPPPEGTPEA